MGTGEKRNIIESARWALLGLACCLSTGCGSGSDMPLIPVSGRVTFDGGPCPADGSITFSQIPGTGVEGMPIRPGRARFGSDGQFEATSFQEGDGLLPGRYRVRITCLSEVPPLGKPIDDYSYVSSDYRPEELVVEVAQKGITVKYDVPLNPKKK